MQSCGYLDVKISEKSRRGFIPWKAWQRQWCELHRLDGVDLGAQLILRSSSNSVHALSTIKLARSVSIWRTESRTKLFAFGLFDVQAKKPLIFLAAGCEKDAQHWMGTIRRYLSIASYLPVGESNYRVSLVDNAHSKNANLLGLFGVLRTNEQDIVVGDPCTGQIKIAWKWFQFHQFHLQAGTQQHSAGVVIMHTTREFPSGAGQIHLYCPDAVRLLHHLVSKGKDSSTSQWLLSKRLSRSEGDLLSSVNDYALTNQTKINNFGLPLSMSSATMTNNNCTKTPGGSENELNRRSASSLGSGIYEEIVGGNSSNTNHHVYESPNEFMPPPLPPRLNLDQLTSYKGRCNTLPARDLSRMSRLYGLNLDSPLNDEYVIMSPPAKNKLTTNITENFYMPMVGKVTARLKQLDNCYKIVNQTSAATS